MSEAITPQALSQQGIVERIVPKALAISVVILTHDSADIIPETIASAKRISDDIHVVDSYSEDNTLDVLSKLDVHVVQHEFDGYAKQRNWASNNLPLKHEWELHLDADEALSDALIKKIHALSETGAMGIDGFFIPRLVKWMGRELWHGGMYPIWHMRLFRHGKGRCEDRNYDNHFYVDGASGSLDAPMIDTISVSLTEWVTRHNGWANAELKELLESDETGRIPADKDGNPVQVKRYHKKRYYQLPLFLRAFMLFFYRYVIRLGFLDGKEGLIFYVLQTFWFRFLVDAKYYEAQRKNAVPASKGDGAWTRS